MTAYKMLTTGIEGTWAVLRRERSACASPPAKHRRSPAVSMSGPRMRRRRVGQRDADFLKVSQNNSLDFSRPSADTAPARRFCFNVELMTGTLERRVLRHMNVLSDDCLNREWCHSELVFSRSEEIQEENRVYIDGAQTDGKTNSSGPSARYKSG
jgi:hypothetical protein